MADEIPVHRFPPRYGACPRLRPVEAHEVQTDGQRAFVLRLPGPGAAELLVPPEALAVATYFDGKRDLRDIQRAIREEHGQLLYVERIDEVARALWRAGMLEQPGAPVWPLRPAVHAGTAYEGDPALLGSYLDELFVHPDGPGLPEPSPGGPPVRAIVTPHIDLHRGGPVYAHAYRTLVGRTDADLFVVLGTAHATPPSLLSLTRADYDTPLGPLPTDRPALAAMEQALGEAAFRDEAVHQEEHSIEFQAVMLRHLFPDRAITMLPVLCSSLYPCAARGGRPGDEPEVRAFLEALARAVQGRRVCYVAAADLSHVGARFGDPRGPTAEELQVLEERDRESLAFLERGDEEGFFDHVAPDAEVRRICGLTPIYLVMRALGGAPLKLLKYAQWVGEEEGSAVSFAAGVVEQA